jgi:hypothetical protein
MLLKRGGMDLFWVGGWMGTDRSRREIHGWNGTFDSTSLQPKNWRMVIDLVRKGTGSFDFRCGARKE